MDKLFALVSKAFIKCICLYQVHPPLLARCGCGDLVVVMVTFLAHNPPLLRFQRAFIYPNPHVDNRMA